MHHRIQRHTKAGLVMAVLAALAAAGISCRITETDSVYTSRFTPARQQEAVGRKARYMVLIPGNTVYLTGWRWHYTTVGDSVYPRTRDTMHVWIHTAPPGSIRVADSVRRVFPQRWYANTTYDTAGHHMATFFLESADSAIKVPCMRDREGLRHAPTHTVIVPYMLTIGKTWNAAPYLLDPFARVHSATFLTGTAVVDTTLADRSEFKPYKIGGTWYYNGVIVRYYYTFGNTAAADTSIHGTIRLSMYLFKDVGIVQYDLSRVTRFDYPHSPTRTVEERYHLDRSDDPQKNPFSDKY